MSHALQNLVNSAVNALRRQPSREALESLAPLVELRPQELLPELFLQLEEAADGAEPGALAASELVPDVALVPRVVHAVRAQDLASLPAAVPGDYSDLVVTLLATVAVLRNARKRT